MKYKIILSLLLFISPHFSYAKIIDSYKLISNSSCSNNHSLIIVSGNDIVKLIGMDREQLSLLSLKKNKIEKIIFQIDQKDSQGRYILSNNRENSGAITFTHADELVFRKKDLGKQLSSSSKFLQQHTVIEIEVSSDSDESEEVHTLGWVYILQDKSELKELIPDVENNKPLLSYDSEYDVVISPLFKIGFSKDKPFLMNAFHWRIEQPEGWTPDVTDTMKIRHLGKFFGFPFQRTDGDYFSKLIDVKTGPLRIIRRTENKVKVFWKLKSPALYIDYVMMPDGFLMDTLIDIPFNISFFFSDLITLTTMDWNHTIEQPELSIQSKISNLTYPVNGQMTADKYQYNQLMNTEFSVESHQGTFDINLEFSDDLPLQAQLYLMDDLNAIDLPEDYPGQFGNVGFKTIGWEAIDSKLHHLKFTVCVSKNTKK